MLTIMAGSGLGLFTDRPPSPGPQTWQPGRGQHHVNVATGNLVLQCLDERLSGVGPDLLQHRTYNAQAAWDDADADGWRWSAERRVTTQGHLGVPGATVTRIGGDAREQSHRWDTARACYVDSEGQDTVLYDEPRRELVWLHGATQTEERYAGGTRRLKSQSDASGNSTRTVHDANGLPLQTDDPRGRQQLTLQYTATAPVRLQQVDATRLKTDAQGRVTPEPDAPVMAARYGYDSQGRLSTVGRALDAAATAADDERRLAVTGYQYDAQSRRIVAVAHADGSVSEFGYDAEGRVAQVRDAAGTLSFHYEPGQRRTEVRDALGHSWLYDYDAAQRLTQWQGPAAAEGEPRPTQRWQYDEAGRLLRHENERGAVRSYAYDARGDLVLETDALGHRTHRRYDDRHQVVATTVQDADATLPATTTRGVHDARGRLRFAVSPEGRVVEHRYGDDDGLLAQSLRYTAARLDVSALGPDDSPDLAAMLAWQQAQDPRQVMQTEFGYDARGNPARRLDPALTDAQGRGVVDAAAQLTEFVHGAHGEALRTEALRGSDRSQRQTVARAAYDGIGRLIDADGAQGPLQLVHDSAARESRSLDASGLATTLAFDAQGRCVTRSASDGGSTRVTRQVFDEAGRLRLVQDALGGCSWQFHDAQGRLAFTVDREAAVTGYVHDLAGQLVRTTRYAQRVDTAGWFDGTRVLKARLVVGGAGADIEPDAEHDRSETHRHDAGGRLVERVDAQGVVTRWRHDAQGRIVEEACADRIQRFFHDRDGLLIGKVDAQGQLTEWRHDAAGRCVRTLRYGRRGAAAHAPVAPVWEGVHDVVAATGQPLRCRLPAPWAPDGSAVQVEALALPPGLQWDAAALMLTGIAPGQPGRHPVALRARCGDGALAASVDIALTLDVQRAPPRWGPLPDVTLAGTHEELDLQLPAVAPQDGDGAGWVYSMRSTLPPGLVFDAATRRLSGRVEQPGLQVLSARVAHADDPACHADASFTLHAANRGPAWIGGVPVQRAVRTQRFTLAVPEATDPDGQPLRYRIVSAPAWLGLADAALPALAGTPPADAQAPALHTVVLAAEDPLGETALLRLDIEIENAAPLWPQPLPPMAPVAHGQPVDWTPPPATDPEGGAIRYQAVTGLPPGLAVDALTGRLSGVSQAVGSFDLLLQASDAEGAATRRHLLVVLTNEAPVYQQGLPDLQVMRGNPIGGRVPPGAFRDPEGDALSACRIPGAIPGFMPGLSPGLYFHADSGTIRFYDPSAAVGTVVPVTVEVSDAHGAVGRHVFRITVIPVPASPPPPLPPPPNPLPGQPRRAPASAPLALAVAAVAAFAETETDPLAPWRPADGEVRSTWFWHDGLGREVCRVDETGFLVETVFDEAAHQQRSLHYPLPLAVQPDDTPALLRARAGDAQQSLAVEFDANGRPLRQTGPDGSVTLRSFDAAGRLVRELQAAGTPDERGRRWRYDAFGALSGEVGGEGDAAEADTDAAIAGHGLRHVCDDLGRRARTTDANGHTRWSYYDREGRLTHTVNAAGELAVTRYSAFGQPVEICRHARRIDLARDGASLHGGAPDAAFLALVAALRDPERDSVVTCAYDRRGLLLRHTDAEGVVTLHGYTVHGQLATQHRSDAGGHAVLQRHAYDRCGRELLHTADAGASNAHATHGWDGFGRLLRSTDAAGQTTHLDYPDQGRTTVSTDPLGRTLRTEHDHRGRVVARVDALGRRSTQAWDDAGRSLTQRSALGHAVLTSFSRHGERLGTTVNGQAGTRHRHDRDGRLLEVLDALGQPVQRHRYDGAGRRVESIDAAGTATQFLYDRADRLVRTVLDPAGLALSSSWEHDALGRVVRLVEGQGEEAARVTLRAYDREDRLVAETLDPEGLAQQTRWQRDSCGRVVAIVQGAAGAAPLAATLTTRDGLGRVCAETVAPSAVFGSGSAHERDLVTCTHHDAAGRACHVVDPLGHPHWQLHDAAGQPVQQIDAEGSVTDHRYARDGQLHLTRRHAARLGEVALAALGEAPAPVQLPAATGDACTRFVHDDDGRLCFTLQALGDGSWRVQEQCHDAQGRVVEWRGYDRTISLVADGPEPDDALPLSTAQVTHRLRAAGFDPDQPDTVAGLRRRWYAYDANGRQRYVVDAQGGVDETVYDAAGRTVEQLRHARPVPPRAHAEAELAALLDWAHPDNRRTRQVFDAAGRAGFVLRSLGAQASLVQVQSHGPLGELRRVLRPVAALAEPEALTPAALQAAVQAIASADDRVSEFDVDALGRVRARRERLAADAWRITTHAHDALGRVLRTVVHARLASGAQAEADDADRATDQVFDAAGRLRWVVAPDGALHEQVFDAAGRLRLQLQHGLRVGPATPRTLTALLLRRGARRLGDGSTRGEERLYDRADRLVGVRDAAGHAETYVLDALGRRSGFTDKAGAAWEYAHDALGRLVAQWAPAVAVQGSEQDVPVAQRLCTQNHYDLFDNLLLQCDAAGTPDERRTQREHDTLDRLVLQTEPGWYDPATGRLEAVADAEGLRWQRTQALRYDVFGHWVRQRTRSGPDTSLDSYRTYDGLGRPVHEVDALGQVSARAFNAFDEVVGSTRHGRVAGPPPAEAGCWSAAALDAVLQGDDLARRVSTTFDALGRVLAVQQPQVDGHDSAPLPRWNADEVTPFNASPRVAYGYAGALDAWRSERVHLAPGRSAERWRWVDAADRVLVQIDALGQQTRAAHDAWGGVVESVECLRVGAPGSLDLVPPPPPPALDAGDRVSRFVHDALGRQTELQRGGLRAHEPEGDGYRLVVRGRAEMTTVLRTTYDALGRVLATDDALGRRTRTDYNALGQLVRIEEPASQAAAADAPDPFRGQAEVVPVTTLTLDRHGQVLRRERGGPGAVTLVDTQRCDAGGQVVERTDAAGTVTRLRRDALGQVVEEAVTASATLGDWQSLSQTLSTRHHHDALGRRVATLECYAEGGQTLQSGQRRLFNAFGEVVEEQQVWGAADAAPEHWTVARLATQSWDAAGRLVRRHAGDGVTRWLHDLQGRVTREERRAADAPQGPARITETGHDALGRARVVRLPRLDALVEPLGERMQAVTPFETREPDRWGRVRRSSQGGYVVEDGTLLTHAQAWTEVDLDADDRPVAERGPVVPATHADGRDSPVRVQRSWHRDALGRVVEEVEQALDAASGAPVGAARSLRRVVDAAGQVLSEVDATGRRTEFAYDLQGRRVGTRDSAGTVRVNRYDGEGRLLTHALLRRALPPDSDPTLDPYAQPYDSRDPAQVPLPIVLRQRLLDSAGREVGSAEFDLAPASADHPFGTPQAHWLYRQLDERGLVCATRDAAGTVLRTGHDVLGQRRFEEDANQNRREWLHALGGDGSDGDAIGVVGRLLQVTVGGDRRTRYDYNGLGQLVREHYSFQSGERRLHYHANGLLREVALDITRGSPDGEDLDYLHSVQSLRYDHDPQGRRARESHLNERSSNVARYEYDPETRRTRLAGVERQHSVSGGVVWTHDDALGRLQEMRSQATGDEARAQIQHLRYRHDALGGRRSVEVAYQLPGQSPKSLRRWFDYDAQGRLTVADGVLDGGRIVPGHAGCALAYDALGRRARTERWVRAHQGETSPDTPGWTYAWQEHHEEACHYNDLGQLVRIDQRVNQRKVVGTRNGRPPEDDPHDRMGQWQPSSRRRLDWRGLVLGQDRYSRVAGLKLDNVTRARHVGQVASRYRADARLHSQWSSVLDDGVHRDGAQTYLQHSYDAAGVLQHYTRHIGTYDGSAGDITHTYRYRYTMAYGGYRTTWLEVTSSADNAVTDDVGQVYDGQGLLAWEYVNAHTSNRWRRFQYDGEGRIVSKLQAGAQDGRQDYFHSDGRFLASLGALAGEHFVNGLAPLSGAGAVPESHLVRAGESLRDIAEAVYGDGLLWNLIADANSLGFAADEALPAGETGKSYRIPADVGVVSNRAGRFRAYDPGAIIGDFTPEVRLRPVEDDTPWWSTALVTGVTVLIHRAGTAALTPVMGPVGASMLASAAANAAGQGTAMLIDQRDDFSWEEVAQAGVSAGVLGSISAVPVDGLKGQLVVAGASHLASQGLRAAANDRGFEADWRGLAASLAATASSDGLRSSKAASAHVGASGRALVSQLVGSAVRGEALGRQTFGRAVGSYLGERAGDRIGTWAQAQVVDWMQRAERRQPVLLASSDPDFLPFPDDGRNEVIEVDGGYWPVLSDLERSALAVWLSGDPRAAQKSYRPGFIESRVLEVQTLRDQMRRRAEAENWLRRNGPEVQRRVRIQEEAAREYQRERARILDENSLLRSVGHSSVAFGQGAARGAVKLVYEPVALGVDLVSLSGAVVWNAALPQRWEVGTPHMFSSYGKQIESLTEEAHDPMSDLGPGEARERIASLRLRAGISSALGLAVVSKGVGMAVGVAGGVYGVGMAVQADTPLEMAGAFGEMGGQAAGGLAMSRLVHGPAQGQVPGQGPAPVPGRSVLAANPPPATPAALLEAPPAPPVSAASPTTPAAPMAAAARPHPHVLRLAQPLRIEIHKEALKYFTIDVIRAYVRQAVVMYPRTNRDGHERGGPVYVSPSRGADWVFRKGTPEEVDVLHVENMSRLPKDAKVAGWGHTHPVTPGRSQETLSKPDVGFAGVRREPVMVATPAGRVRVVLPAADGNPKGGQVIELARLYYAELPGRSYLPGWPRGLKLGIED